MKKLYISLKILLLIFTQLIVSSDELSEIQKHKEKMKTAELIEKEESLKRTKSYKITKEDFKALNDVGIDMKKYQHHPEEFIGNPYWLLYVDAQKALKNIIYYQAQDAYDFFNRTSPLIAIDGKIMHSSFKTENIKNIHKFESKVLFFQEISPLSSSKSNLNRYEHMHLIMKKNLQRHVLLHEICHAIMAYEMYYFIERIQYNGPHTKFGVIAKMNKGKKRTKNVITDYSSDLKSIVDIKISLAGIIGEYIFSNVSDIDLRKFYALYPSANHGDFYNARESAISHVIRKKHVAAGIYSNTKDEWDRDIAILKFNQTLKAENIAKEALELLNNQCKEVYEKLFIMILHSREKIEKLCDELETKKDPSKAIKIEGEFINPILVETNKPLLLPLYARKEIKKMVQEIRAKEESHEIIESESKYEQAPLTFKNYPITANIVSFLPKAIKEAAKKKEVRKLKKSIWMEDIKSEKKNL